MHTNNHKLKIHYNINNKYEIKNYRNIIFIPKLKIKKIVHDFCHIYNIKQHIQLKTNSFYL
jgi:hypothetical protein